MKDLLATLFAVNKPDGPIREHSTGIHGFTIKSAATMGNACFAAF
jgi:hypothetical protein